MAGSMTADVKERAGQKDGVAAVERALAILDVFADAEAPLRLAEIAAATGLYKSTVLRLMVSLERFGYLRRDGDGRYLLGATPLKLGRAYQRGFDLGAHVLPALQALVEAGTESASFHVREGAVRLCLYRIDSAHSTLDRVAEGMEMPLERGAPGRVLLAFAGEAGKDFETIRRDHIAVSMGERDPHCGAVAAPVFGAGETLLGALSVSGPLERFTEDRVAWQRDELRRAATRLTRLLGGTWHGPEVGT